MKFRHFYLVALFCFAISACKKIEVPTEIKSFYPESIDGVSYAGATIYEVEKTDGETFEIILNFEGGSGYEDLKIINRGIDSQVGYHATYEASEVFSIIAPEKGSTKGSILVSGVIDYSQYWSGIQSSIDKYSFYYYFVDKMGITRTLIISFVQP
jgi:hypothetical protein